MVHDMSVDRDSKVVFGISWTPDAPVVILGIPQKAFEAMMGGTTQTFDLTKVGLPLQIVMFADETYDGAKKVLEGSFAKAGVPVLDETRRDFSITPKAPRGNA